MAKPPPREPKKLKPKVCRFCKHKDQQIDYKDAGSTGGCSLGCWGS
jgi:ribosomal protein S18